jgi:hypothetical protein
MTSPRQPGREFRLERLGEEMRPAHLGEAAQVASLSGASSAELRAAYEALIDAVFTAPGAAEWLVGLRMRVAALIAGKEKTAAPRDAGPSDAIQASINPGPR